MSHDSFDLGDHHHVEPVADLADDLDHVVQRPRRVERVDARPQACARKVRRHRNVAGHVDEAAPRRDLVLDGDGVLEVAEDDVDLAGDLDRAGAHLLHMRRHEMDHPLDARGQVAERGGRADRERLEELARRLHGWAPVRGMLQRTLAPRPARANRPLGGAARPKRKRRPVGAAACVVRCDRAYRAAAFGFSARSAILLRSWSVFISSFSVSSSSFSASRMPSCLAQAFIVP